MWFGIDFLSWVYRPPDTPLWLWFTPNSLLRRKTTRGALEPLRSKNPQALFDDGTGGLVVPVLLPLEVGYEVVLEAVVARLAEVARLLSRRRFGRSRRAPVSPDEYRPLREADLRPDLARRMPGLQRLVDDATARGLSEGWADTSRLRVTPQPWGYGRYVWLGGAETWFGIDFHHWVYQPPDTPLWLRFRAKYLRRTTRGALEPLRRKNPRALFDYDEAGLAVPVPLPVEKKYAAVLDHVAERVEEVARLIGGTSRRGGGR